MKCSSNKFIVIEYVIVFAILLSGCGSILNAHVGTNIVSEDIGETKKTDMSLSNIDRDVSLKYDYDIDISETAESEILINKAGTYRIEGSNDAIRIVVDVYSDEVVRLIMDDVHITNLLGPAIVVNRAAKCIITIPDGSNCVISDGPDYENSDYDSCIYSNCDLTVNGLGSLTVYGYFEGAVHSKDIVRINNSNIFIEAKGIGIKAADGILVNASRVSSQTKESGFRCNKGEVNIFDSEISIISGENGIEANSDIIIKKSEIEMNVVEQKYKAAGELVVE